MELNYYKVITKYEVDGKVKKGNTIVKASSEDMAQQGMVSLMDDNGWKLINIIVAKITNPERLAEAKAFFDQIEEDAKGRMH